MFIHVKESRDLRKVLSQNIKKSRAALHITQAKLAEYADISVPHIVEIELCRTWVSDKTLANIASALNMEAYELLIPEETEKKTGRNGANLIQRQIADLIKAKKNFLRQKTGETLDDLTLEIVRLFESAGAGPEN
jgi:transcriptional regulator with XRE-family HTH domain